MQVLDMTVPSDDTYLDGKVEFRRMLDTKEVKAYIAICHAPNLDVLPKPHKHSEHEMIFLLKGSATFTNGKDDVELGADNAIIFDSNEEHYAKSGKDGFTVLEMKW